MDVLSSESSVTHIKSDAAASVRLHCAQCYYDLRSISATSRCPECGLPVKVSLRGRELGISDIPYLKCQLLGTYLLLFGLLGLVISMVAGVCLVRNGWTPTKHMLVSQALDLATGGLQMSALVGSWLLAGAPGRCVVVSRARWSRKVVQWSAALILVATIGVWFRRDLGPNVTAVLGVTEKAMILGWLFGVMFLLKQLARTTRDQPLYKRFARVLLVMVMSAAAAATSLVLLTETTAHRISQALIMVAFALACYAGAATLAGLWQYARIIALLQRTIRNTR